MENLEKQQTGIEVTQRKPMSKLDRLVAKRTQAHNVVLACDVSGSMAWPADTPGERRIDALRGVIQRVRSRGVSFKQLVFSDDVLWSDVVPEPNGGTNLTGALEFMEKIKPEHIVIVSDGVPNDRESSLVIAARMKVKIDVFYVGPKHDGAAQEFMNMLAKTTGGSADAVTFAELENKIAGVLTDGLASDEPAVRGPISL